MSWWLGCEPRQYSKIFQKQFLHQISSSRYSGPSGSTFSVAICKGIGTSLNVNYHVSRSSPYFHSCVSGVLRFGFGKLYLYIPEPSGPRGAGYHICASCFYLMFCHMYTIIYPAEIVKNVHSTLINPMSPLCDRVQSVFKKDWQSRQIFHLTLW